MSNASPARPNTALIGVLVSSVIACVALAIAWGMFAVGSASIRENLFEGDVEAAKRAAWRVADEHRTMMGPLLLEAIRKRKEPAVREACIYALGRIADRSAANDLAKIAALDQDGYLRQAAWLALARADAEEFRRTAEQTSPPEDAWGQIGIAQAGLELGDTSGVSSLLRWSDAGTESQRQIACGALARGFRPLLETAGRWPLDADPQPGDIWPRELIAEVTSRAQALDRGDNRGSGLRRIAVQSRAHFEQAAAVRRLIGRIAGGRDRIVRILFG